MAGRSLQGYLGKDAIVDMVLPPILKNTHVYGHYVQ